MRYIESTAALSVVALEVDVRAQIVRVHVRPKR